jgi:hypothetical protein
VRENRAIWVSTKCWEGWGMRAPPHCSMGGARCLFSLEQEAPGFAGQSHRWGRQGRCHLG